MRTFDGLNYSCHRVGTTQTQQLKTTLPDGVGGGEDYFSHEDKTVSAVLECYLPTEWMRHGPEEWPGFPQDAQRGMEEKQEGANHLIRWEITFSDWVGHSPPSVSMQ